MERKYPLHIEPERIVQFLPLMESSKITNEDIIESVFFVDVGITT